MASRAWGCLRSIEGWNCQGARNAAVASFAFARSTVERYVTAVAARIAWGNDQLGSLLAFEWLQRPAEPFCSAEYGFTRAPDVLCDAFESFRALMTDPPHEPVACYVTRPARSLKDLTCLVNQDDV